jgi:hypothetical protein
MNTGQCEIVNSNLNIPFLNAKNNDLVIRTDNTQQKVLFGNNSNVLPGITLSNNYVGFNVNPVTPFQVGGPIKYSNYAFSFSIGSNGKSLTYGNPLPFDTADSNFPYTTITSNAFKAPVKGLYMISAGFNLYNVTSCGYLGAIHKSSNINATPSLAPYEFYYNAASNNEIVAYMIQEYVAATSYCQQCSVVVNCNSNEYIRVMVTPTLANSFQTYPWAGSTSNSKLCFLTGHLICPL